MAMNETLVNMQEAWDKTTDGGRDTEAATAFADQYVAEHPEVFTEDITGKTGEELVAAIDVLRAAGMNEQVWQIQAWLWHNFLPQDIGGNAGMQIRVTTEEAE